MNFIKLYKKEFMKDRKSFVITIAIITAMMLFLYSRVGHWTLGIPTALDSGHTHLCISSDYIWLQYSGAY